MRRRTSKKARKVAAPKTARKAAPPAASAVKALDAALTVKAVPATRAVVKAARASIDRRQKTSATADSEDSPAIYFRQISAHALIDAAGEKKLAKQLRDVEVTTWRLLFQSSKHASLRSFILARHAGEFAADAATKPLRLAKDVNAAARAMRTFDLDRQYIDVVIQKIGAGPDIRALCAEARHLRDTFVRANLRLVVSMARRYLYSGMPLADLIQEGNLGLVHAVPRFDHRRGLRFSTFAVWWIRHAISRACADKVRTVRVPVHIVDAAVKIRRRTGQLAKDLGRAPTPQEISKSTGIPVGKLESIARHWLNGHALSLDAPTEVDGVEGRSLVDNLADPKTEDHSIETDLIRSEDHKRLAAAIDRLRPHEADVLRKRYGLGAGDALTLREIGDLQGLSRERIRQLETAAIKKLRSLLKDRPPRRVPDEPSRIPDAPPAAPEP